MELVEPNPSDLIRVILVLSIQKQHLDRKNCYYCAEELEDLDLELLTLENYLMVSAYPSKESFHGSLVVYTVEESSG